METAKRARRRDDYDERRGDALPPELPCLPPEMIREILLRLPAKSIAGSRSVSKLFRSLSSDPAFAKTHLDLSLRNEAFPSGRTRLIVPCHNLYTVDFDSICDGCDGIRDVDAVEIHYPLKDQLSLLYSEDEDKYPDMVDPAYERNPVAIFGSCNGLVCISPDEGALFLINPTTGESKRIPDLPESLRLGSRGLAFGFWFDSVADDYKVVTLVVRDDVLNAVVYSLKTDSWKRVSDLRYNVGFNFHRSGVLVNGVLHWIVKLLEDHDRPFVVAFDTMSEQFRDMPLPDEAEGCPHSSKSFEVGKLNGRLCIVNYCHDMHDDIWVMNEYGVASSWSGIRVSMFYGYMQPLCSARNKEYALAELDRELVLCNLGNCTSRPVVLKGRLVSPNSYGRA
ncbi:PREDICTED: F-box/kelch-repeat protein At3g06240-like [Tarenaya hassleriana]|uniref:F-box/kelch-repeat protein At3g06240-like n=1 Tax=Tarenaya hassleriana TaxID=28532 RepID=UPI00053C32B7|nr:PREDICTED: F-box/kelch-repeat protein At3g06240-like [Tarenaya hassleriana]